MTHASPPLVSRSLIPALTFIFTGSLGAASPDLAQDLIFYAPFENGSLNARVAEGDPAGTAKSPVFLPGPVGEAVRTGDGPLTYPLIGNFKHARGTVSLWVRDIGALADNKRSITLFDTVNFALNFEPGKRTLFFMTGTHLPPNGFLWDYSCQTRLHDSLPEWTHFALVWNQSAGTKKLYVNGKLSSDVLTDRIRDRLSNLNFRLQLGLNGSAAFDEVAVWSRELSDDEIAVLSNAPQNLAAQAAVLPIPNVIQHQPLELGFHTAPTDASIIEPGQSFKATVPLSNNTGSAWKGKIVFTLLDFDEHEINRAVQTVSVPSGRSVQVSQSFSPEQPGIYKIAASIDAPELQGDIASFVVWPRMAPLADDSFFGLHANSWDSSVLTAVARLGYRWNRNHNMLQTTWWPRVQPESGAFVWLHEDSLERNQARGFQVLGQFFGTPHWASPDGSLKPQRVTTADSPYPYGAVPDKDAFRSYVAATVRHYRDRIHHWEMWNEPDVSRFWNGDARQFAEFTNIAVEETRKEDPDAFVMAGGFAPGWPFVRRVAEAGGFKGLDAISMHLYFSAAKSPAELYRDTVANRDFYRQLIAAHADRDDLPIWMTEGGVNSTTWLRGTHVSGWPPAKVLPPINARLAAIRQVQHDVFLQQQGFQRGFAYLTNSSKTYASLSDLDINRAPKPQLITRTVLAHQVDGLTPAGLQQRENLGFFAGVYATPDDSETLVVTWIGEAGLASFSDKALGGKLASRHDLMGRLVKPTGDHVVTLTDTPCYLRVKASASNVINALQVASIVVAQAPTLATASDTVGNPPAVPSLPDYAAPVENPTKAFTVDLRPFANMGFADERPGDGVGGWSDEGDLNDFRTFTPGPQIFYGVTFDIADPAQNNGRSVITLKGNVTTRKLPVNVTDIPIPQGRVRTLYFLHSAAWAQQGEIARYVVHYADGRTETLPVTVGINIGDWWKGYSTDEESRPLATAVPTKRPNDRGWRYPRVWEWQNPRADVAITSIDFISTETNSTPILIGLSGVLW